MLSAATTGFSIPVCSGKMQEEYTELSGRCWLLQPWGMQTGVVPRLFCWAFCLETCSSLKELPGTWRQNYERHRQILNQAEVSFGRTFSACQISQAF